ncbi:T-cell activation inhibitor, mitochondrial isoform X1 [Anguilla rostrata]
MACGKRLLSSVRAFGLMREKLSSCGCRNLKVDAMSVVTFLRWTTRTSSKPVAVQMLQKRALSGTEAITALRPFYFAVHPDFFGQHPREREVNENSLKRLNGYLENLQKPGFRTLKPTKLTFYVRETTERKDEILSSGFRSVSFTLNTKDVLSTVQDVLRSCSLSMEHMQGLESSAGPDGRPPQAGGAFYRPIRWDKTYYAFTGYRDPEQELEQAKRVEPTLSLWLRNNEAEAAEKQKSSVPRREELKRLKTELCSKLGLTDVRWQRSWGVAHRCCQLQSLSRLSQQNPESLHNLRGHILVFTDQSGMNASGHVMLGTMDVHHQWAKLFGRLPSYRALLQQTEWLKERISLLLGGIQVIHIERRGPLLTLEEHYSSLNAFHKRLLPRRPALHPRSLQDLAMTLESGRSSTVLHELGHFIVPTACETHQLPTVLQSQAQEARRRVKQHEKLEMEEQELVRCCKVELSLSRLQKEASVSSPQMMACCRHLLEERPVQLQGLRLCVSHFYSVQQDGDLCIPWDWKG